MAYRAATEDDTVPPHSDLRSARGRTALINVSWESGCSVSYLHQFVEAYARSRFPRQMAERLALASNELLENALSYSLLSKEVTYEMALSGERIEIIVTNHSVPARIDLLQQQLERLNENPEQVYKDELEKSMTQRGGRGMLGLVRASHEAQMAIELRLGGDGTEVTVVASCRR